MSKSGNAHKKTEKHEHSAKPAPDSHEEPAGTAVETLDSQEAAEKPAGDPPRPEVPAKAQQPTLTPEQIEELKTKAAKADENWERFVRNYADFENYKKRAAREREDAVRFTTESLFKRLIPVLDSFDMAMSTTTSESADPAVQALKSGMTMVQQQLKNALAEAGLEEVDASGKEFDPNFHEAVLQQDSEEVPEGHVLQQMRKGYKFKDRLIRPATVIVAKKPSE
jgi:molecular chaperone GrpE